MRAQFLVHLIIRALVEQEAVEVGKNDPLVIAHAVSLLFTRLLGTCGKEGVLRRFSTHKVTTTSSTGGLILPL
jgi:hypothetical protein